MVTYSQHPVFSLLFLIFSFILSAFILFTLECEFLALIFITIYVGAIAIFIFNYDVGYQTYQLIRKYNGIYSYRSFSWLDVFDSFSL